MIQNHLEEYQQKRNFEKTNEPSGKRERHDGSLIFVVQKHNASHLHYDLRLELNGVLKSWAVPKGPSLNPNQRHLAMMVEDHPLDYKDFEGVIPEGNYGAGTVMVWDKGTYHSAGSDNRDESEKELITGLEKGHISFVLEGQKLKGEFALVRLRKSKEKNAWLLIKANDYGSSTDDITKYDTSAKSGRTMNEIKSRSEKIWESQSGLIDFSGTPEQEIPTYAKPMLATLINKPFSDSNWMFEIKWDGYRALSVRDKNKSYIFTRNHNSLNKKFPDILNSINQIPGNFVLDGEIVVLDQNGKPSFNLIQNYEKNRLGILVYYIFDILYLNNHLIEKLPLLKRKEIVSKFLPKLPNVKISEYVSGDGISFFNAAREQNLEGIIGKNKNSVYEEGARSPNWVKIKTHKTQEVVIGGYTEPERGRHFLGSLLLGVYKDGDLLYVGNVGTGFDDLTMVEIKTRLQRIIQPLSPFVNFKKNKETTWVKPELVCEIKFQEWTDDSIRQPIFLGLRDDKNPREIVREYPKEQYGYFNR